MDKMATGLLGAVAGMATMASAQAVAHPARDVAEALRVSSYADLLKPIPDAVALLKADDAARAQTANLLTYVSDGIQLAQAYYYGYGNPYNAPYPPYATPYGYYPRYHHHHHHHHRYHHHHHHHHHGFFGGRR